MIFFNRKLMQFLFDVLDLNLLRSHLLFYQKQKVTCMKKLIMVVGLALACAGFSFAQTAPAKKVTAKKETQAAPAARTR
jgi:hypothetical protein